MLWRRGRRLVAALAALVLWLLACGWLAGPLLDLAQPAIYRTAYDPARGGAPVFGPHTSIVMLGGGTDYRDGSLVPKRDVYPRIATAAALYAQCRRAGGACRVIVSGGNPQHHAASEADTYAPWLLRAGVPPRDLVLENASLTTWENARNVMRIVHAGASDETLLLVTSGYHMRRAMLDFRRFGAAPLPVVSNVRVVREGWRPRAGNLEDAETALHELIGIAQFHVYRMLGWF